MSKRRLKGLAGVAIAAFFLVSTDAPNIADAAQFKPVIQTPRIIVRPPNVTPQSKRLLKKKSPSAVTNPAATQGGSAAEANSPVQNRTPPPLRSRNRAAPPIPRPRPQDDEANIPLMVSNKSQKQKAKAHSQKQKAKAAQVEALEQEISAKREAAVEALVVAMVSAVIKIAGNALPPFTGNPRDSEHFDEAVKRFRKKFHAAEADISDAQKRVDTAVADADSVAKNLEQMQNQPIPEAQQKDDENLRAQMERERAQLGAGVLLQQANSWWAVKQRVTQYLTLPKNHPKFKALAARTQKDLEAIDGVMAQIGELKSSKRPNKDAARGILGKLGQIQLQLQQTEKELAAIRESRSDGESRSDKAELDQRRWEAMESIADSEIEEAKNNYEEAREQFKLAMRILQEHLERATQVTQKITS